MADGKVLYEIRGDDSKLDGDLDQANAKVNKGSSKLAGAAKGIALGIGAAFIGATTAAIKFGSDFETAMAGASTLFGDVNVDTDNLNSKMLELSNSTGIAASELGNTLYNALSAGIPATEDMGEAMEFLDKSARLAKAGFTDIDTAMSATAKTMNAYGMDVSQTDRIQKILMQTQNKGIVTVGELGSVLANVTPTAAAMGVSFEQVGAGIANMTAQGTPAAQATTQLNSLFAELGKSGTVASDNLALAAENTQYAGMSFQDMMEAGVPLNEVLNLMGTYADDNGLGMIDMFSSIEAGKAALANGGEKAKGFTDALGAMSTQTDVVGDAYDKISGTSADKFNKILNQLKNTAIELFFKLEPLISEALPMLEEVIMMLIPPLMELVERFLPILLDLFSELLPAIIPLIETALPVIIELFEKLIPPIIEIIKKLLPPLIKLIDALLPIFLDLIDLLMPIIDLFLELLDPIIDLINIALKPLLDAIMPIIKMLVDLLVPALNVVMSVFSEVFKGIADLVTKQIKVITDIFKNIIDFVKNVFTGNWKGAWENIKNIFSSIATGIGNAFKAPINFIIDLLNGFINGINKIKVPDWVPIVGGMSINIPNIPRLKIGMDYVPSDDFPALLHQGEAVLTAEEAAIYRAMGSNLGNMLNQPSPQSAHSAIVIDNAKQEPIDYERLGRETVRAFVDAGIGINVDGREFGRVIDEATKERR